MSGVAPGARISVAIPSYNYGRFLDRAIRSALAQTYPIEELIVVENGSTDDSWDIARGWAERDPRVRVVRHLRVIPAAYNWNRCVEEARGDWLAVLSADDMLEPEFCAATVERALAHPKTVLVGVDYAVVDADDRVLSPAEGPWRYHGEAFRGATMPGTAATEASLMRGDNSYGTPSMHLFRRDVAVAVNGWDEEQLWLSDWDFTMRLFAHGDYAHVPRVLTRYRMHDKMSTTFVGANTLEPILGPVQFLKKLTTPGHPYGPLDPAAIETYRRLTAEKVVASLNAAQQAGAGDVAARIVGLAKDPVFAGLLQVSAA